MPRNPNLFSFAIFWSALPTVFDKMPQSLKGVKIFMISYISSFTNLKFQLQTSSAGDTAAVNSNGIKNPLDSGATTFAASGKPILSNRRMIFFKKSTWVTLDQN